MSDRMKRENKFSVFSRLWRFGTVAHARELLGLFCDKRLPKFKKGINQWIDGVNERRAGCGPPPMPSVKWAVFEKECEELRKKLAECDEEEELEDVMSDSVLNKIASVYFCAFNEESYERNGGQLVGDALCVPSCKGDLDVLFNRLHSQFTQMFNSGFSKSTGGSYFSEKDYDDLKKAHQKMTTELATFDWSTNAEQGMQLGKLLFLVFSVVFGEFYQSCNFTCIPYFVWFLYCTIVYFHLPLIEIGMPYAYVFPQFVKVEGEVYGSVEDPEGIVDVDDDNRPPIGNLSMVGDDGGEGQGSDARHAEQSPSIVMDYRSALLGLLLTVL